MPVLRGWYLVTSNQEYLTECLDREVRVDHLAPQNFSRIDQIMRKYGGIDTILHDLVMDIKIVRMKKVMLKHSRIILTQEQAAEIWGRQA